MTRCSYGRGREGFRHGRKFQHNGRRAPSVPPCGNPHADHAQCHPRCPAPGAPVAALGRDHRPVRRRHQDRRAAAEISAPGGICRDDLFGQCQTRDRARASAPTLPSPRCPRRRTTPTSWCRPRPWSTPSPSAAGRASRSRPFWRPVFPRPARTAWRASSACGRSRPKPASASSARRALAWSTCAKACCSPPTRPSPSPIFRSAAPFLPRTRAP